LCTTPLDVAVRVCNDVGMQSRTVILTLAVIALAATGSAYYFYSEAQTAKNPQQAAEEEARELVAAVSKLIVLPDELPVVATVADPAKLAGQPFFQNAKVGDKVLIFNEARKAVLFSPDENRIVDVAPLSIGQSATPAPTPSVTE
jgi:hypothetical protein